MEDTKRKVEVMKAYVDGKQIQVKVCGDSEWRDCTMEPDWDWVSGDYRVKPAEKYRPYKDYGEMVEDFCDRFAVLRHVCAMPLIWVKQKETGTVRLLKSFSKDTEVGTLNRLFVACTYLDGSVIGKKVEDGKAM